MNSHMKASLDAFNASKNCDRTSAESFYQSYIDRKKEIISRKVFAMERGSTVNTTKLNWEMTSLKELLQDKIEMLAYINKLLKNTTATDPKSQKRNTDLLEEANRMLREI